MAVAEREYTIPASINLATPKGVEALHAAVGQGLNLDGNILTNVFDYIKNGKSRVVYNKIAVVSDEEAAADKYLVKNNQIFMSYIYNSVQTLVSTVARLSSGKDTFGAAGVDFQGVLIPNNKQQLFFAIINGDGQNFSQLRRVKRIERKLAHITISYECLGRFAKERVSSVANRLVSQSLELVDYTADETVKIKADDLKALNAWKKRGDSGKKTPCPIQPPQAGFSLVGNSWHRSATALFYDKKNEYTILLGQDEGTYFGCQLKDNPKSIKAAYASLTPKEASVAGVERQGEWFAVPVAEKEVPKITECVAESDGNLSLPRDHEDSAYHTICSNDIRVAKTGLIYARDASVEHSNGDHADLRTQGWVVYHRNTAIRSFSVEGVD